MHKTTQLGLSWSWFWLVLIYLNSNDASKNFVSVYVLLSLWFRMNLRFVKLVVKNDFELSFNTLHFGRIVNTVHYCIVLRDFDCSLESLEFVFFSAVTSAFQLFTRKLCLQFSGLRMLNFTWNRFPIKNLLIDSLLTPIVESTYLNMDMCTFESSQKDESRVQSTDSQACPWECHSYGNPMGNVPWDRMGQRTFVFPMRLRNRMRLSECYWIVILRLYFWIVKSINFVVLHVSLYM